MTGTYVYCVAGWRFAVDLPAADAGRWLPSFAPFLVEGAEAEGCLFRLVVREAALTGGEAGEVLEESRNDLGHVVVRRMRGGYRVELRHEGDSAVQVMLADDSFTHIRVSLRGRAAGAALCSMLRIAFSQAVLLCGGVSLHAAAVVYGGRAYLFMGRSGTGKSTHAAGWLRCMAGSRLLNDDNPVIRIRGGEVWAYGTPWSGKTPCYLNEGYPVAGIVRLYQAPYNRFRRTGDVESFVALLPGCFAVRADKRLYGALCDTLLAVGDRVTVGTLHCLPDDEAVLLCRQSLMA